MHSDLSLKRNIPTSKPAPTEDDYEIGFFTRHFVEKVNEPHRIYETSTNNLNEFSKSLDENLYNVDSIIWSLRGEKAVFNNESKVKVLRKTYLHISSIFPQPDEYVQMDPSLNLNKLKDPNQMLDEIPTFTLEQWNMFDSLDKEKLIIKYGEVNISDLEVNTPTSNTNLAGSTGMSLGGSSGGGGGGY